MRVGGGIALWVLVISCLLFTSCQDDDRWVVSTYDGTLFNDIATNFFTNTTCPILLYYSYDDPWTAGKPRHVGPNVKMVINPIGKHSAIINDPALCPPETKKEVMDYVSRYIY